MKVAVVGAGVVGVTTAYELAADGHEVTVFECRGSVAAEASFANAGLVAPGCITPWAAPRTLLRTLLDRDAPVRSSMSLAALAWLWRWSGAAGARSGRANRARMQRLAHFSRERLQRLTLDLKLDCERSDGCLVLLRSSAEQSRIEPGLAVLSQTGTRFETLGADQCRVVEPGLSAETALHAGIYLPDDGVGNCRQFAVLMRSEAQRLGVRFRFHTPVSKIVAGRKPQLVHMHQPPADSNQLSVLAADSVHHEAQDTQPMAARPVAEDFDAVIVCAALGSAPLLRPLGLTLPLQSVFGYSITAPLRRHDAHPDQGPRSAVLDERHQVAISRLGARVRVAGGAEIGGRPDRFHAGTIATLYKVLHDWFPAGAHVSQAQRWKGARAVLPDGPPLLGASGVSGVWLNLGHGDNGWALACGSARLLADALAGRTAVIDLEKLGVQRLKG
jgi:D-amino-acid dehydrogenase